MNAELLTTPAPVREDYEDAASFRLAWLDWRRTGIGGSDAPIIAGVAPKSYGSRLKVQWDKLGLSDPEPANVAMRRGNALEPLILQLWEERAAESLVDRQALVRHADYPFMVASLDGVRKNGRIVEAKSMNGEIARHYRLGPDGDAASIPLWWRVQAQHQMACYGTDLVTFPVLVDDDFRCYDVERDQAVIDSLIETEADFWDRHVLQQIPCRDYAASDADMIGRRYRGETGDHLSIDSNHLLQAALAYDSLGETMSELNRQVKEAKEQRDVEKAAILAALGDSTMATLPMGYTVHRKMVKRKSYTVKEANYPQIDVQSPLFERSHS